MPLLNLARSPSNFLASVTLAPRATHTCFRLFSGIKAPGSARRHTTQEGPITHRHRQLCATRTVYTGHFDYTGVSCRTPHLQTDLCLPPLPGPLVLTCFRASRSA